MYACICIYRKNGSIRKREGEYRVGVFFSFFVLLQLYRSFTILSPLPPSLYNSIKTTYLIFLRSFFHRKNFILCTVFIYVCLTIHISSPILYVVKQEREREKKNNNIERKRINKNEKRVRESKKMRLRNNIIINFLLCCGNFLSAHS